MAEMNDKNTTGRRRKAPRLREGLERLLNSRGALFWMGVISFLENTVLLFAVEPLFIPVMLARKSRAPMVAAALLAGCLAGAVATYFAAAALYEPFIVPLLERFDLMSQFQSVRTRLEENGFWALVIIGFTPIPFQLGTVSAGIIGFSFPLFVLAVLIGRAIRYFGLAFVLMWLGRRAENFLDRYQLEIGLAFALLFLVLAAWAFWG